MITVRCPSCQAEVRGPESIVGKRVRCKRDDCRSVFVFEPPPPAPPPVDDPWEREPPGLASSSYEEEFDDGGSFDELPAPLPKRRKKKNREDGSDERYPELHQYLGWWRVLAVILLGIYFVAAAVFAIVGLFAPFYSNDSAGGVLTTMLLSVFLAICIAILGYVTYVSTVAVAQFIHVIIDIEDNTRRLAGKAE